MIPVDGNLSFDDLLMRIHPAASRVAKLSAATPSIYIVFDLLVDADGKKPSTDQPLAAFAGRRSINSRKNSACATIATSSFLTGNGRYCGGHEVVPHGSVGLRTLHRRKARRFAVSNRRAHRHAEDQKAAHRGLRRWRISLPREEAPRRVAVIGSIQRKRGIGSRWIHVLHFATRTAPALTALTARKADQANWIHRQSALRTQLLEHQTFFRVGAARSHTRGGNSIRPFHGRPLPARNQTSAMAS